MPAHLDVLRDRFRGKALEGLEITRDQSLDSTRRNARLDRIQGELKALQGEIDRATARAGGDGRYDQLIAAFTDDDGVYHNPGDGDKSGNWGNGAGTTKALGGPNLLLGEAELKGLQQAGLERQAISVKAPVDSVGAPMAAVSGYQYSPLSPFLRESQRVASLLPSVATSSPSVTYFRGLTGATSAAPVAEGAAKPESTPSYESVQVSVRKIAHYARATDEVISDFPSFTGMLGTELLAGLIDAENAQLLTGSGAGVNLTGMLNATGILTRARGVDSRMDAVLKAIVDIRTGSTFSEATGIILHPSDWQTIRLEKDANGRYLSADPISMPDAQKLWGLPAVVTTKMTQGTAMVGNFDLGTRLHMRESPRIESSLGGLTEFTTNVMLFRAEERLALATPRPAALCKVTGL